MLVLSRKRGEAFSLGEGVEIMILEIEGGTVKVGIRAPKDVIVLRHELKVTSRQNESAAVLPSDRAVDALLHRFQNR